MLHGAAVEVRDDRIFEGVWNGGFADGAFDSSSVFCGTGLVLERDGVKLVPPFDLHIGAIYVTPDDGRPMQSASNSLLCWLTKNRHTLEGAYYFNRFIRIIQSGITPYLPELQLGYGASVGVVY